MGRGGDDYGIWDLVGDIFGLPDEFADFVEDSLDETAIDEAIEESILEMEAMIGNAGQEAIMEDVFDLWPDACHASTEGGSPYAIVSRSISHIQAVEEIVMEGEEVFFDALES